MVSASQPGIAKVVPEHVFLQKLPPREDTDGVTIIVFAMIKDYYTRHFLIITKRLSQTHT